MSKVETLEIFDEISSLVSDRLQVVSYKWLSRYFLVSSNAAKKLLQEFVEKQKDDWEVVYSVAGWLKKAPTTYHISLVPGSKLAETKQAFDGNCSVQVYSVQACIPKDPVAIWNAEFIQAEELFQRPIKEDNCLRDNRFCGVLNSFVKRNAEGAPVSVTVPQAKGAGIPGQAIGSSANQTSTILQPQHKKLEQASSNSAFQSSIMTGTRSRNDGSSSFDVPCKESDKDNTSLPVKKKGQSNISSAGTGSSLANMWGRASTKPKVTDSDVEEKVATSNINEAATTDDDDLNVNFKRASTDGGKKRRVVFDDSDEEEAVNLGSLDVPKSNQDSRQKSRTQELEKNLLKFVEQEECKPIVMEENSVDDASHYAKEEFAALYMGKNVRVGTEAAPSSPKKRRVLKTRIDERGREVTEVVWEGKEINLKDTNASKSSSNELKNSSGHIEKVEEKVPANPVSRAATVKKSPVVGSIAPSHAAGKAGAKKGANTKDPKQGNILSFFKKV